MSLTTADPGPRAQIARVSRWYHTIEVAPGVLTPGWFDLRPTVARLPWPDVQGRRCLDIGTADGFLAFELERRGAAEVVALDLPSHSDWDFEVHVGELGTQYLEHVVGAEPGRAFAVAHQLLASRVVRETGSVYDLAPERLGRFDVVVCGSLLLHLRDPLRALAAIRSVCAGELLCTNQVDVARSLLAPRRPLLRLDGTSGETQWWLPNAEGHRQLLRASGFQLVGQTGLYAVPYGTGHPPRAGRLRGIARRLTTGHDGVPHHAILAR